MAILHQLSEVDLFLLTTPDDTEEAPWMVMADLQVRETKLFMDILQLHVQRKGLPWYLASYLKIVMPRPAGTRSLEAAPDMLMAEADDQFRTSWDIVAEGKSPQFVLEVSSASSWERDSEDKPLIYQAMGVREYAVFAPQRRDGGAALFGYRSDARGKFRPWPVDRQDVLWSRELGGLGLVVVDGLWLRVVDAEGNRLQTPTEWAHAEAAAREAAEMESARLREELRQRREGRT